MKNRPEIEMVMDFYPGGIPVIGLKVWTKCELEHVQRVRGRFDGAIMTVGLSPDQFRKLARVMLQTGMAELVGGFFKLKGTA